jgi:antitoxin component YwqK of YwqJK toxin-antitoxin module
LIFLTLASCNGNPETSKGDAKTPSDSLKSDVPPMEGNSKRVYALGHFFAGVPNTEWRIYEDYSYDDAGREISYQSYFDGINSRVTTEYDGQGFETLKLRKGDAANGNMEYRSAWNADHTEQKVEVFSAVDSRVISKTTRHLDTNGVVLATEEEDLRAVDYPVVIKLKMVYNEKGQLVEEREVAEGKEIVGTKYKYDPAGHLIEVMHMDSEGKPSQTESFEYDAEGRKTTRYMQEHTAYIKSKQLAGRYEYDPEGRLAREVQYRGQCDPAGEKAGKCPISQTVTYTYDADGRVTTESIEQQYPSPRSMKKRYEYHGKVPVK